MQLTHFYISGAGDYYYWNQQTNETVWDKPRGGSSGGGGSVRVDDGTDESKSSTEQPYDVRQGVSSSRMGRLQATSNRA